MIDLNLFTQIRRTTESPAQSLVIRVRAENGFALSSGLMKRMSCRALEVFANENGTAIVLRACEPSDGMTAFKVQKSGGVNAKALLDDLRAKGVSLPAVYTIDEAESDERICIGFLTIKQEAPASARKAAKKPRKAGLAQMLPDLGGGG